LHSYTYDDGLMYFLDFYFILFQNVFLVLFTTL